MRTGPDVISLFTDSQLSDSANFEGDLERISHCFNDTLKTNDC